MNGNLEMNMDLGSPSEERNGEMNSPASEPESRSPETAREETGLQETQSQQQRRKKVLQAVTWVVSVIFIPVVMTVLLSAYEDQTNEWVHRLLEGDRPETWLESMKRLTAQGNLPENKCGSIGTTLTEATNRCGVAPVRNQWWSENASFAELSYIHGNDKWMKLTFQNDRLKKIEMWDKKKGTTSLEEMFRVFGKPVRTNDGPNTDSKATYYTYLFSGKELTFWFNRETGKLDYYFLETAQTFPLSVSDPPDLNKKDHPVGRKKWIHQGDGLTAARQLKRWIDSGDLGNYDCGVLGTSYHRVKAGRCGMYEGNLQQWIFDDLNREKRLIYEFKDRKIRLGFYMDSLTSISIDEKERPLGITKKQIERVFGQPAREKDESEDLFSVSVDLMEYKLPDREVTFYFDEKGRLNSIWLRKSGLYDQELGMLLPQKQAARQ